MSLIQNIMSLTEVFVQAPHDGQLLECDSGGLAVAFDVTGTFLESGFLVSMTIDGETSFEDWILEV